ncbi:MAG: restriction endonuclease [Clostridiales bacterium]|jgi:hypothetical protein|nr:restriction endonuclease [Clostridiales bacterium]
MARKNSADSALIILFCFSAGFGALSFRFAPDLKPFWLTLFVLSGVLLLVIILRLAFGIRSGNAPQRALDAAVLHTGIDRTDKLSPFEFEQWIARFLTLCGFDAATTPKSGDYGVDVLAGKDGLITAIQVKKYAGPLGVKCVQEVAAGMRYYNAHYGWVASTAPSFTRQARNLAKTCGVELFTKNDLALMLYALQQEHAGKAARR